MDRFLLKNPYFKLQLLMVTVPELKRQISINRVAQLRLTIAGFLGLFIHGNIVALPGAFLPQWTAEFGNNFGIAFFYNLLLFGSLLGITLTRKRRQRHPLLALSFLAIGIALLIAAASPNFNGVLVTTALIGWGDGILNLQCNSLVGELHPQRRVALLNWANATFGLGAVSTPLLATFLSWRIICLLVALLSLVSVALAWQAPAVQGLRPKLDKMPWRRASIFLLLIMFYTGLESSLGTWSGTYLIYLGQDVTYSSKLLSLYWGGLTLGRMLLAGWVGKQPTKALSLLLGCSLGTLGLVIFPPLAPLLPLVAFFYGPLFATLFALLQEKCGHVALGYLFYAAYIGKSLIPVAFIWLKSPAYLPYGFILLALILYLLSLQLNRSPQTR
ncbi:MAG: MFS transporter [Coleofasciculaceae cyanobacterium]